MIRIPIRMGSNRFVLVVDRKELKASELVELALTKSRVPGNSNSYSVFESANGVERRLRRKDDVIEVLSSWASAHRYRIKPEFVLRKIRSLDTTIQVQAAPLKHQESKSSVEEPIKTVSTNPISINKPQSKTFDLIKNAYSRLKQSKKLNSSITSRSNLIASNSCGNSSDEEVYDEDSRLNMNMTITSTFRLI